MKRLLCLLSFGHWKRKNIEEFEKSTVTTTSCLKCGEQLLQVQEFKEPWATMIRESRLFIVGAYGQEYPLTK